MENIQILQTLNILLHQQGKLQNLIQFQNNRISELIDRQLINDKTLYRIQQKINYSSADQNQSVATTYYTPNTNHNINQKAKNKEVINIQNNNKNMNDYDIYKDDPYGAFSDPMKKNQPQFRRQQKFKQQQQQQIVRQPNSFQINKNTDKTESRVHSASSYSSGKIFGGKKRNYSIPKEILNNKIFLRISEHNVSINQFKFQGNLIIAKSTGSYQLMMDRVLDLKRKSFFQICVRKTYQHRIIVGIASTQRMKSFTSHESGKTVALNLWNFHVCTRAASIKNYKINLPANCIIKVEIDEDRISWIWNKSNKQNVLASVLLPPQLKLCHLSPYLELYDKNDIIQLM